VLKIRNQSIYLIIKSLAGQNVVEKYFTQEDYKEKYKMLKKELSASRHFD
jgi:hypothetical protein